MQMYITLFLSRNRKLFAVFSNYKTPKLKNEIVIARGTMISVTLFFPYEFAR